MSGYMNHIEVIMLYSTFAWEAREFLSCAQAGINKFPKKVAVLSPPRKWDFLLSH